MKGSIRMTVSEKKPYLHIDDELAELHELWRKKPLAKISFANAEALAEKITAEIYEDLM